MQRVICIIKVALFAGKDVGYEVAKIFGRKKGSLACLVIDSKDISGINEKIIMESGIHEKNIIWSDSLKKDEGLNKLKSHSIDLAVLSWWPYIIKQPLLGIPKNGFLNFHPSLLPYNKGKHPNFWAIKERSPFGVTLHFIDEGVDTGPICYQKEIKIRQEDTGKTIYKRAQKEIVKLFDRHFEEILFGNIPKAIQPNEGGSFHLAKEIEDASKIDLEKRYTARELIDLMRARTFPPYPGAWFIEDGKKYEIRVSIKKEKKNG